MLIKVKSVEEKLNKKDEKYKIITGTDDKKYYLHPQYMELAGAFLVGATVNINVEKSEKFTNIVGIDASPEIPIADAIPVQEPPCGVAEAEENGPSKDLMIVRQACLKAAATLGAGKGASSEDVKKVAEDWVKWVFSKGGSDG